MEYAEASASARRTLPPAVAVSSVAFALQPPSGALRCGGSGLLGVDGELDNEAPSLWIPLVRRIREPFRGQWALPGGPTHWDETLADTALRSIRDAAGRDPGYLEQLYAFGGVERSADAQRLVTIAYWALFGEADLVSAPSMPSADLLSATATTPKASDARTGADDGHGREAPRWDDPAPKRASVRIAPLPRDRDVSEEPENVAWCAADRLPELAFDHAEIVAYALARLRSKTAYAAVAHRFLGPVFTIAQLRAVHEAVLGHAVEPANFRRQMLAQGTLTDTGAREVGTPYRPARLYRFREEAAPSFPTDRPEPRSRP